MQRDLKSKSWQTRYCIKTSRAPCEGSSGLGQACSGTVCSARVMVEAVPRRGCHRRPPEHPGPGPHSRPRSAGPSTRLQEEQQWGVASGHRSSGTQKQMFAGFLCFFWFLKYQEWWDFRLGFFFLFFLFFFKKKPRSHSGPSASQRGAAALP